MSVFEMISSTYMYGCYFIVQRKRFAEFSVFCEHNMAKWAKAIKQRQKQSERQMGREAAAVSQSARAENSLEGTAVTGELPGEAAAGQWMPGNE